MTVYFIIFSILTLSALLMELPLTPRARLTLFIASYAILLFFVGLRWETGNDWAEYYVYYQHLTSLHDKPVNNTFEIGYRLFSIALKRLDFSYSGFLLTYSAVYLGFIFFSFRDVNYSLSGWLVLQLFAPFILGLMGTSRQVMALAICMFSVRYLLLKDWRKFLLCVAVATAFHISALVFLIAWPLARIELSFRRLATALAVVATLSLLHVGTLVSHYAASMIAKFGAADLAAKFLLEQESTSAQFGNAAGDLTTWYIVVRLCTISLFLLAYPLFSEESDKLYFRLYVCGFCMLFLLSGALFVLTERAALYFTIFQIHLLALPTRRFKRPVLRQSYCVGLIALSLVRLYTGLYFVEPKIFVPYKGVIVDRDVHRDLGWFKNDL